MRNTTFKRLARNATLGASVLLLGTAAHAAINVSTQATQNMSCGGGVCTATAQKAYLNVNDVTAMLAGGDLKIATAAGAQDIHIQAPFSWTSTSRLTLDAQRSIEFEKPVSVAGTGALTLITNDGGTGGDYWFDEGASVTFWDTSSSLIINGQSFTLVKDIAKLAAGIAANPSGNFALSENYNARRGGTFAYSPVQTVFEGTFEGLGNTINNFSLRGTDVGLGLFLEIDSNGAIRDIRMTNARIKAINTQYHPSAGVIAGFNLGTVSRTFASGAVTGSFNDVLGGLVGISRNEGIMSRNVAAVRVQGGYETYVGGLVGVSEGAIFLSSASGDTWTGHRGRVGGLVGSVSGSITQSFATGSVRVRPYGYGGGLVGEGASVKDSYATGTVEGMKKSYAGGLAGAGSSFTTSYAAGKIIADERTFAGGALGENGSGNSQDYWDSDTSGIDRGCGRPRQPKNCRGLIGLTDAQLKSALPDGFDPAVWGQSPNINNGYPYLLANPPPKNAPGNARARSPAHPAAKTGKRP